MKYYMVMCDTYWCNKGDIVKTEDTLRRRMLCSSTKDPDSFGYLSREYLKLIKYNKPKTLIRKD